MPKALSGWMIKGLSSGIPRIRWESKRKRSIGWAQPDQYPLKTRRHRAGQLPTHLIYCRAVSHISHSGRHYKGTAAPCGLFIELGCPGVKQDGAHFSLPPTQPVSPAPSGTRLLSHW